MISPRRYNLKLAIAIILCITLIVIPSNNSYAERLLEQYGDKVTVSAELTRLKINYKGGFADFNDPGGFMTGEVAVLYSFSEPGHRNILETELNLSGWDLQLHDTVPHNAPSTYKKAINRDFAAHTKYIHVECHPTGTLNAVFTVYNVNGRWPNWEGILVDAAKAASFATLRQLAIEVGYVAAEGSTMGGLLVAAAGAVIIQNILYTIRGNESLGIGTLEIDLQELGENGEKTYTVTTAETQYGNAEIEFKVKTVTEDIPCSDITSSATSLHHDELYAMLDDEFTTQQIPGWIKQNAKWWADGTISDADFASGIGFLAMHGIISTSMETKIDGTILINENLSIPSWIKQNAKWWADGTISDADFASGIEYMMDKKIITLSEPPTKKSVPDIASKKFKELYVISRQNEAITSSLVEITIYQKQVFNNAIDDAWEKYEQTQEQSDLKDAQKIDSELKDVEKRIQLLSKTQGIAKQSTQNLVKTAAKHGLMQSDLENSARGKIISVPKIDTHQKMSAAIASVENASKQNVRNLETALGLPSGKVLDELLWNENTVTSESMGGGTGKITSILGTAVGPDFFKDYYGVSDHMPISAVFDDNWLVAKAVKDDMQVIMKINTANPPEQLKEGTKTEPEKVEEDRQVAALVIGGKYYPLSQFVEVPAHEPNCDASHYHSEISPVVSSDGTTMVDPNPSTCGFGKVGIIPVDVIFMSEGQINAFREATGLEP
ncbi:conserved hypothetical protein [Candidatus Nitrosotenuis uzonensis]|uniref:Uncharacterized protein n=1 Tax=Candidatus Nitrosotenuis uzonensis TaxID=1407055 RepID=A0A812F565_9ARCH|nr:conserved hypothetical protein [Candidatus Nitrosotenuis uzonensis]